MFSRKKKPQPQPESEKLLVPQNPYIFFELVDDVHLEVSVGWPVEADIQKFAHFLALLNSGSVIGPQLAEVAMYASRVNQPEKAVIIHAVLENVASSRKKDRSSDRPLVPPSKVIANQMTRIMDH